MTVDEYNKFSTYLPRKDAATAPVTSLGDDNNSSDANGTLPAAVDWRTKGVLGTVKVSTMSAKLPCLVYCV